MIYLLEDDESIRKLVTYTLEREGYDARGFGTPSEFWQAMDGARPELVENVESLDQYGTVFLGYPNWWYGVPMAVLTFLEENDLSGKQVYLFCSHGTGGLANSVEILTQALPNATLSDNIFDCSEEEAAQSQQAIQTWVAGLGN